jgi:hypothetical protein
MKSQALFPWGEIAKLGGGVKKSQEQEMRKTLEAVLLIS